MRHLVSWMFLVISLLATSSVSNSAEQIGNALAPDNVTGGEWRSYNKSLDGQRFSLLRQINTSNAGSLAEVCRTRLADQGSFQAGLLVIDGVMYATTPTDTVALNPVTCEIIWRHRYDRENVSPLSVNRGVAYYGGRLFRGSDDGRVYALDARTGAELWTNIVGDPALGEMVSGSPLAWNGIVIVGTAVSEFGVRGRVIAYDAMSGRELWNFDTVPRPGEPGSDTWRNTVWNDIGGGGGGTWSHFALDPSSGEVFIPVGNPIPDFVPAERLGDNLYTNCVLVLDAFTGELKWWYQLAPSDGLDHDLAAAPMLYRNSDGKQMVAAGGKDGYLHIIDRSTKKLVAKTAVTTVDEPVPVPTPEGLDVCPGVAGGVEWNGPAFDPKLNRIFVGSLDYCSRFVSEVGTKPDAGGTNYGGSWTGIGTPRGWLYALDADTGAVAWRFHADDAMLSGTTPTAGGVVMSGDNSGKFFVFDSANGNILKTIETGGSLSGGVITYDIGGKQYVAITSGNQSRTLFGASGRPNVIIMALPDAVLAAEVAENKPDLIRGNELYFGYCGSCHGGQGDSWAGVELKAVKHKMNLEALIEFIKNPRSPMPHTFPHPPNAADEARIRDIASFLMQWR
ncbi:MAG: PQQ-binding-like beta-propeller repeat protein [Gammaproteobacteria bacterium]